MYRIVSICLVMMVLVLGVGSQVSAQTINVNNCPNISTGTWNYIQEKVRFCYVTSAENPAFYPSDSEGSTRVTTKGTFTFYQRADNNCLFAAHRQVETTTGPASAAWYTGVIYDNGTKITLHTLAKWDSDGAGTSDGSIPQAASFGELKFNKMTNMGTKITYAGNSQFGFDFYSPNWVSTPHCNESTYVAMTPAK